MNHIAIVTVLFDALGDRKTTPGYSQDLFKPFWVDKLYRGIERNITRPFTFYCITHYPKNSFMESVKVIPFLEDTRDWICLNEVYRPDLDIGRAMFFALDTVITGNIDGITGFDGDLGVVDCDGVFANPFTIYTPETAANLWRNWKADQVAHMRNHQIQKRPSELRWLEAEVKRYHPKLYHWHYLDRVYPGQMWSWCIEARDRHDKEYFPDTTRIIYFHGYNKQHNCGASWVEKHWI